MDEEHSDVSSGVARYTTIFIVKEVFPAMDWALRHYQTVCVWEGDR